ncbi:Transcription factor [Gnomoniopsis smithogilvyi]|uniref:Transcription factor n=1 Tax=Gnomoniopsis smithogilvyi TaxID=1191159 RepID=A0A9W8Z5P1_9PEZI|nr:Transcription factor [Gnomoniopsis smithogilvyi]
MDSSSPLPSGSPTSEQGRDGDTDKPRLTEEQKRQNHITSEQKRRQGIRYGFDKLCEVVPGLEGQGRSEGHVLNETTRQLLDAIEERKQLVAEVERRGGVVPDHLKGPALIDTSDVDTQYIRRSSNNGSGNSNST